MTQSPVPRPKTDPAPTGTRPYWGVLTINLLAAGIVLALILGVAFAPGAGRASPALAARSGKDVIANAPASKGLALAARPTSSKLSAHGSNSLAGGTPAAPTPEPPQPPVPQQGGICIEGSLIDTYEQRLGGGWKISAVSDSGQSEVGETDASGYFRIPRDSSQALPGGSWVITLEDRVGWRAFTPNTFSVALSGSPKDGCVWVRFKQERLACLVVTKADKGGQLGLPEMVGIPEWEMTLALGTSVFIQKTDGKGKAYFTNLLPGVWLLEEEIKMGWRRADWPLKAGETPAPGKPNGKLISLPAPRQGDPCRETEFVNEQVHDGCLIVRKEDTYGNPQPGWTFTVRRDDGTQADMVRTTDAKGEALFTPLALGKWTVTETMQKWWRPTDATVRPVEINYPGFCPVMEFINESLGGVDGYKINHLEQGLPGWRITATSASTGEVFSATTDASGYFAMILPLGVWTVAETVPNGWKAVTASHFTVTLNKPFVFEHVRFKNRATSACVDIFKRDSFDKSGLPGWTINLKPKYGGQTTQGVTDGAGWVRFSGLTPGWYLVEEQVLAGWAPNGATQVEIEARAYGSSCVAYTFWNHQANSISATAQVPPGAPVAAIPTVKPGACQIWYYVQPGDTPARIAGIYGVSVEAIKAANNLTSDMVTAGQKLCIP